MEDIKTLLFDSSKKNKMILVSLPHILNLSFLLHCRLSFIAFKAMWPVLPHSKELN